MISCHVGVQFRKICGATPGASLRKPGESCWTHTESHGVGHDDPKMRGYILSAIADESADETEWFHAVQEVAICWVA